MLTTKKQSSQSAVTQLPFSNTVMNVFLELLLQISPHISPTVPSAPIQTAPSRIIVSATPTLERKDFSSLLQLISQSHSLTAKSWNSSLTACGACLVTALTERGGGPVPPPSTLSGKIYQDINNYCTPDNAPDNGLPGVNSALTLLYFPGWLTTETYFSQILLYNMTVLVENASIPAFPPNGIPA
jgi:hypothetical protein